MTRRLATDNPDPERSTSRRVLNGSEHHVIGEHFHRSPGGIKDERDRTIDVLTHCNELVTEAGRSSGKLGDHALDDLVIAADDVIPLVVAGQQFECRARAASGDLDQVKGGLISWIAAVLGHRVGQQQLAEAAARADARALEPFRNGHRVQPRCAGRALKLIRRVTESVVTD